MWFAPCRRFQTSGYTGAGLGGGATKRGGKSAQAIRGGSYPGDAPSATRPKLVPAGLAPQLALRGVRVRGFSRVLELPVLTPR